VTRINPITEWRERTWHTTNTYIPKYVLTAMTSKKLNYCNLEKRKCDENSDLGSSPQKILPIVPLFYPSKQKKILFS
jgi:hypothetical protein